MFLHLRTQLLCPVFNQQLLCPPFPSSAPCAEQHASVPAMPLGTGLGAAALPEVLLHCKTVKRLVSYSICRAKGMPVSAVYHLVDQLHRVNTWMARRGLRVLMQLAQRWRNHLKTPFGPSSLGLTRARDALYTVGSDIQPFLAVGQAVVCRGAQTTEKQRSQSASQLLCLQAWCCPWFWLISILYLE